MRGLCSPLYGLLIRSYVYYILCKTWEVAKPCQCPDCGKFNRIRKATLEESKEFQARKLEDVWQDSAPALAG